MSEAQAAASINTGDEGSKGPSIEDQYNELVKEGLIAPEGDTPGDDEAGEAKDKGSNDERPAWLDPKYKTVEDFLKSHKELERKLSEGGTKKDEPKVEETPDVATAEEKKAATDAAKKAGVDLRAISQAYLANGELTAEDYTKLEAAGYPREMVDVYAEGLMNRLNATQNAAFELVGGEAQYGELIDWAIANLPQDEQDAFDEAVNSNNKARALFAIKGLKAARDAAVKESASEEPEEQISKNGKSAKTTYDHIDDYMADLNDPRYDTNETFRRKVMEKLDRSNIM
jgi:hypothetical protein